MMIRLENFKDLNPETYDLVSILQLSDKYFNPPLSERLELEQYANKLKTEAVIHAAMDGADLVGVSAFYCTPGEFDTAFLTFIVSLQRGRKIGDIMLNGMINYCTSKNMKAIETQTWEGNASSLSLFERHGFKQVATKNNRANGVQSIILRHDFNQG